MIAELIEIIAIAVIEVEDVSSPNPRHLEPLASVNTLERGPARLIRCRVEGTMTSTVKVQINLRPHAHSEEGNVEDIRTKQCKR